MNNPVYTTQKYYKLFNLFLFASGFTNYFNFYNYLINRILYIFSVKIPQVLQSLFYLKWHVTRPYTFSKYLNSQKVCSYQNQFNILDILTTHFKMLQTLISLSIRPE